MLETSPERDTVDLTQAYANVQQTAAVNHDANPAPACPERMPAVHYFGHRVLLIGIQAVPGVFSGKDNAGKPVQPCQAPEEDLLQHGGILRRL